jgi:putative glutamine amidotransferase
MASLIAVAGYVVTRKPDGWPRYDALIAPANYIRAVRRAGGLEALLMPSQWTDDEATQALSRFDGLLLLGGGDVDPAAYGEEAHPETYGVDQERDAFELTLVHAAMKLNLPVLAVCRGIQVLNVALGGTLDQHIVGRTELGHHGTPGTTDWGRHEIRLEEGSRVARAMGATTVYSSCHHHQAIAREAPALQVVGRAADGVTEAAELPDGWVVGVQWHPEDTAADDPAQQGLFDELVRQAADRAGQRPAATVGARA